MFSVNAGTAEEANLLQLDSALDGSGMRVEGLHDGTLFCRIVDTGKSIGALRDDLMKRLGELDESVSEGIHQIFLEQ
jgi:hypothetical protein